MSGPVVVFCGPTIGDADVRAIVPHALCLPAARCGDVLLALRLDPSTIVLIDGVFERVGAVWHKELLWAIEQGVAVYGAASMGALRASELDSLGMVGVGEVYRRYSCGELVDDDEVAVVHAPSGEQRSDAMIDLRTTIARGLDDGRISAELAAALTRAAKALFYPERTLEAAAAALAPSDALDRFVRWGRDALARGETSLKRRDAEQALRALAKAQSERATAGGARAPCVPRTVNLRQLARHVSLVPFPRADAALPEHERVAHAARLLGPSYDEAKRVGWLLAHVDDLLADAVDAPAPPPRGPDDALAALARYETWLHEQLPPSERLLFGVGRYMRWLRALGAPSTDARCRLTARLLRAIDRAGRLAGITPEPHELAEHLRYVCARRNLTDDAALARWRAAHGLDTDAELGALVLCSYREGALAHSFVVVHARMPAASWLIIGLRLTGAYDEARALLAGDRAPLLPATLADALARDFDDERDAGIAAACLTAPQA